MSQIDSVMHHDRAPIGASDAAAALGTALDRALARGGRAVRRLRHAQTTVLLRVGDQEGVRLLLTPDGVAVDRQQAAAEIEILLDPDQALATASGRMSLTDAVTTGAVQHSGPVRKYLEVDVVLRRLLDDAAEDGGLPVARPRHNGPIAPDLLAIETRGLRKSFGRNTVLSGLDLTIPEGVIAVLLGPSGTGKSVCLQHIIGLMAPDDGEVLVRGRALSAMGRKKLLRLRRDIGVMFQDGALFSTMNVFDNVAFPLRQHTDFPELEVRELVLEQLELVGLVDAAGRMPNQLSGGMRKRAGLARAMVLNPGIVLCDEPDSGLDPVRTALLGDLLLERHAETGGTMVVVTHNVSLARSIADHISVLWRGQVLESGMADDVLASETPFIRQFLSGESTGPLGMDA